jgi:hypothetical protein
MKNLKLLLLLSICFLSTLSAYSQAAYFAPVGATWYYKSESIFTPVGAYVMLKAEQDTLIEGKRCAIISITENYNQSAPYTYDSTFIVTQDSLKIEYFTNGKFTTLYDFNAQKGDAWTIEEGSNTNKVTVTATDSINIQGQNYKRLFVNSDALGKDTVIEKIGGLRNFIPLFRAKRIGFVFSGINCYTDSTIAYKHNADSCETILHVGMAENVAANNIFSIYPNPAHSQINIKAVNSQALEEITIYDYTGRIILQKQNYALNSLDIAHLPNGIYQMQVKYKGQLFNQSFLKN